MLVEGGGKETHLASGEHLTFLLAIKGIVEVLHGDEHGLLIEMG